MDASDLWKTRRIAQKIKQAVKDRDEGGREPEALGSGPLNRHGMPQLPQGQHEVVKWPVLDLGVQPSIDLDTWRLRIDGLVEREVSLSWAQLQALPQVEDVSDFHCVTRWSRMNIPWVGVRFADVMAHVGIKEGAAFVHTHAYDSYTTNLPLAEAMKADVLLVHTAFGEPLAREHGGPLRMITPQLYAWKGAKWINRVEVLAEDRLGFWEQRGYSNTARPWRDDRYS